MLFVEGPILASQVRFKIIQLTLKVLKQITLKFLYWQAKYEVDEIQDELSPAGIVDRMKNLIIYDKTIVNKRYNECLGCEHFIKPTSQCKKCGCLMKFKTRFSWAECPIGKWQKTYDLKAGKKLINVV